VPIIEISCVEVWREISNYLEGEIDPELRRRMEEHFRGCEHCTAILDGTRNVVRLVGDGQTFDLPEGFSERMRKRVEGRLKNGT
jgi:anti-sigma factor RsiW